MDRIIFFKKAHLRFGLLAGDPLKTNTVKGAEITEIQFLKPVIGRITYTIATTVFPARGAVTAGAGHTDDEVGPADNLIDFLDGQNLAEMLLFSLPDHLLDQRKRQPFLPVIKRLKAEQRIVSITHGGMKKIGDEMTSVEVVKQVAAIIAGIPVPDFSVTVTTAEFTHLISLAGVDCLPAI